jgi:hypothetical protein
MKRTSPKMQLGQELGSKDRPVLWDSEKSEGG